MKKSLGHPRPNASVNDHPLLSPHDLAAMGIHYHMNHLRRLWQRGAFPKPFHLSARKIAWPKHEIEAWIDTRKMIA